MQTLLKAGLTYHQDYLTDALQEELWNIIQQQVWLGDLKRRVQHYGYKYDYKARRIDTSMRLGELPDWAEAIAVRLLQDGIFQEKPDQLIVNEYAVGQGIAPHIDCEPCFGDTIVSISLGSGCMMDFEHIDTKEKASVWLAPKSAVVLKDSVRYDWKHSIASRKKDYVNGLAYPRGIRISLTFRKVIIYPTNL